MDKDTAAEIVETIRNSIQDEPTQFNIVVNVTGQHITATGGTGQHITAMGGGPGSTTIGQQVTVDGAKIDILREKGSEAMTKQMGALVKTLGEIACELRKPAPEKGSLSCAFDALKNTWVPGVICSVVGNLLTSLALG